jgi:ribosome biogenesis GTPase
MQPVKVPKVIDELDDESGLVMEGLVIERQGDRLKVEISEQEIISCNQRASLESINIVVGDTVILKRLSNTTGDGVALSYRERRNIIERPVSSNPNSMLFKQIASNVEHMVIVVSCTPLVPLVSIDRYLVIAELKGMDATVVLNKNDLTCASDYARYLEHYPALGYNLIKTSTSDNAGLDELRASLSDRTSIFVGQSGVGKSSLINSLLPDENLRVGDLTTKLSVGSHTTSNARMYRLQSGGKLIDSPGIREFGLWHLDVRSLTEGFKEICTASSQCKFSNCKHLEFERGCAVQAQFKEGVINPYRMKHYLELIT